jgi:hypothetical protein
MATPFPRISNTHQSAGPRKLAGNTALSCMTTWDARPAPRMVSPSQVIRNEPMCSGPGSGWRVDAVVDLRFFRPGTLAAVPGSLPTIARDDPP